MIGSEQDDVLLLEEPSENGYVNIRHTKDFQFVTVHVFSTTSSKVILYQHYLTFSFYTACCQINLMSMTSSQIFLIDTAEPLSGMVPVWECEAQAHCILEHHQGYLYLFTDAAKDGQSVDHHYLLRSPVNCSLNRRKWDVSFYCTGTFIMFNSKLQPPRGLPSFLLLAK